MVTSQFGRSRVNEEGRKESAGPVGWLLNMGVPFAQKTIEICSQAVPPLFLYVLQHFSMQSQGEPGEMVLRQTNIRIRQSSHLSCEVMNITRTDTFLFREDKTWWIHMQGNLSFNKLTGYFGCQGFVKWRDLTFCKRWEVRERAMTWINRLTLGNMLVCFFLGVGWEDQYVFQEISNWSKQLLA